MASARYKKMCKELGRLGGALLPQVPKGDVLDFSPRLSIRALAYRILSHAEIEHYLEDRAAEVALAADVAWKTRRHVSEVTLCLLALSGVSLPKLPTTLNPPPNKKQTDWIKLVKPDDRLSNSVTAYMRRVRQENHGIKEENIISLLLPIGFNVSDLDELFVAELNDFGTKRGKAAHVSVAGHVTAGVNPFDENAQVKRIILGLKAVDQIMSRLLAKAQ